MRSSLKIVVIVVALAAMVALVGAAVAFAQGPTQAGNPLPDGSQYGSGAGMNLMAVDEATMHAAIADALGITVETFEAAVAEGKTPATLAQELGVDFATVLAAMDAVHADALAQAVADGLISQAQADWMLSRRGGGNGQASGLNRGAGLGSSGRMGRGAGGYGGNGGDCLYQTP